MPDTGTIAIDVGGTFTDITFADAGTRRHLGGEDAVDARRRSRPASSPPSARCWPWPGADPPTSCACSTAPPPPPTRSSRARRRRPRSITTAGFKYVLEIGRHDIPRHGNLYGWSQAHAADHARPRVRGARAARRERRRAHPARRGRGARVVARQLAQLGVPAVAVVFLHAYANPAHEQRMQAILAEECPGVLVSLSSEVLPQFREFERTMATALNAAVMPPVSRYVGVLREALDAEGVQRAAPHHEVRRRRDERGRRACASPCRPCSRARRPAWSARSSVARAAGLRRHHLDRRGRHQRGHLPGPRTAGPEVTKDGIDRPVPAQAAHRRHPHDRRGRRQHRGRQRGGPAHAWARGARAPSPGPVCYGRGGAEPTVTDAHLVLGRIPPALLGGEIPLDVGGRARGHRRARSAGRSASPSRRPPRASSRSSTTRWPAPSAPCRSGAGHDPRRFALVAVRRRGPAARLPARRAARHPDRGRAAAAGRALDVGAPRHRHPRDVRAHRRARRRAGRPPTATTVGALEAGWAELEAQARAWLDGEQVPRERQRFERAADLRYEHQSFELTCPLGDGPAHPRRGSTS